MRPRTYGLNQHIYRCTQGSAPGRAVDDINPALPIIKNIPQFPEFRVLKVMQDLYHQQYGKGLRAFVRLVCGSWGLGLRVYRVNSV